MDLYYGTTYPEVGSVFIKKEELDSDEIDIECHSPEDMCPDMSIQDLLDGDVKLPGVSGVLTPSKRGRRVVPAAVTGKRHQCRACHRSYKLKCHLLRHTRQEHCSSYDSARLLRCQHCSYFTQRKWSMAKHMQRWHTGRPATLQVRRCPRLIVVPVEGPPLAHACNSCSKSYDHESALQRHTRLECGGRRLASDRSLQDKKTPTVPSPDDLPLPVFIKLEAVDKPGLHDPGFDDPGLDDQGLDDPGLDDPGLDDQGLDDPGLDDPGLDYPGLGDPGLGDPGLDNPSSRSMQVMPSTPDELFESIIGSGWPRYPKVYRERYRIHCCPTCGQRLKHKGSLALHAKYGCGANRHFKRCAHCDYCTNQTRRMEQHLGTHHTALCYPDRATSFKCSACRRHLPSEASLVSHRLHRCREFSCTHCAYRGNTKHSLTSHIANNHPKVPKHASAPSADQPYQCNVCLRCYKNLGDVNRHVRLCGTNPQYPCAGCGRTYRHQYALDRHLALECGRAPQWRCPHCPFRTKRAFSLKLHVGKKHS